MWLQQDVRVRFRYQVHLTRDLFASDNPLLKDIIGGGGNHGSAKVLFAVDHGVHRSHPDLLISIEEYCRTHAAVMAMPRPPIVIPGGERAKNSLRGIRRVHQTINDAGLCRHSYVVVVGGGAVIDMVGFAVATAHRGLRLIRVPTTVLSQNDSAVGVKNGVNAFGKKNFLGTFTPPYAVLNDSNFLATLSDRDWRSGIAEAIKVALIKDPDFFDFLEEHAADLANRDEIVMQELIYRCAKLHLDHIARAGDPFEFGSARPLDYGHWAAHKLEQLTRYRLRHGEAVAIGIALDTTYSYLGGFLPKADWQRVMNVLLAMGFAMSAPELSANLDEPNHPRCILRGLTEFREHLGGELTVMLLERIGHCVEVHEIDPEIVKRSIQLIGRSAGSRRHTASHTDVANVPEFSRGGRNGVSNGYLPVKPAAVGG